MTRPSASAGYSTWTGVLNAADFGLAQTRRRAFLIASRTRPALPPEPTHADGGTAADLFGDGLPTWRTMGDVLGCPPGEVITRGNHTTGGSRFPTTGPSWGLRREIAKRAGLTQKAAKEQSRVSFGKVAEYQKRGAVHFHAVIRFDGPDGPDDPPPAWATLVLLTDAIHAAAARVEVDVPAARYQPDPKKPAITQPARTLRWGTQLDVRPIRDFGDGEDITERAVASYVAKYATKAAETTGTVDRRIGSKDALALLGVPDHPARLIAACLDLHALYPDRKLRDWAHMLGFRGHFSTKSRRYSTTLGELRQTRADYRAAQQRAALGLPDPDDEEATALTLAHWTYASHGHTPGESWLAANIRRDIQHNRESAREELAGGAVDESDQ
ncbi:replication initiator [Streptomyces parvulus]|uniref:replication initiator n=1 Tax=Streptomyces parvulus TaxID=146923 RepID=UPI00368D62C3